MKKSHLVFLSLFLATAINFLVAKILILAGKKTAKKFLSFHILFPNHWSIKKSHDLVYKIEKKIKEKLLVIEIDSHLEPLADKKSFED
ncbi:MAG: hypothetical protein Fur009_7840 [Candidatus Microgenomates bacterium]